MNIKEYISANSWHVD